MTTENQRIMREIHNEQRELTSSFDGTTLLNNLKDVKYLDKTTKMLLWRAAYLKRTFFGVGFIDDHTDDLNEEDEDNTLLNGFIKALLVSSLIYEKDQEQQPLDLLCDQVIDIFNQNTGHTWQKDEIFNLLSGLIECDTLAAWLLVSEINP